MQKSYGQKKVILMFLLPAFIVYTLFVVVSVIGAGYYSLLDWSGVGEKIFLGINNYKQLFTQDTVFWTTVLHTLVYTVICVVIQVFGGLLFAIFLSRITKFRAGLQTLYYVPVEGYKYLGLYMVIFYAALIGIPKELDEAAIMDGANVIQQYRYVKIPYIRPVIIANCILVLNGSLRSFDISYLLTKGGPGNSSELMSTYMYKQAFTSMKYGYGSAVAMVIVAICLIVGFLFRRFTERGGEE